MWQAVLILKITLHISIIVVNRDWAHSEFYPLLVTEEQMA